MNISVVIPCYNSSNTIRKCIKSVFDQTFSPYEIIVVDDGSSDNTLEILKQLKGEKSNDIELHILSQKNSGPSVARNNGIKHAKGDWIAFLDSDDQWNSNKLDKQIDVITKDNKIVLCGALFGSPKVLVANNSYNQIDFKNLLFKNYFNTPTVLVKVEILKKFMFDVKQRYSEDYKLWLNICYENKCVLLNQSLASNIENKKIYGASGLSSNLWEMEKGELSNYKYLYDSKKIGVLIYISASVFSIVKFLKRMLF